MTSDNPTMMLYFTVTRLMRRRFLRKTKPSTRKAVIKRKALSVSGCISRRQIAVRQFEIPQKLVVSSSIRSALR